MSHDRQWVEVEELDTLLKRSPNALFNNLNREAAKPNEAELTLAEREQLRGKTVAVSSLALFDVLDLLENGNREGAEVDAPEGVRTLRLSDTLARQLASRLRSEKDG